MASFATQGRKVLAMNKYKKMISVIVAAALCLILLTGCGNGPNQIPDPTPTPAPIQTTQTTPIPTATPAPQPTPIYFSPSPVPTPTATATASSSSGTDEDSEASASSSGDPNILKLESEGEKVEKVQQRLKDLGYFDEDITGYFGTVTESAVKKFQQRNDLTDDGIVGSGTLKALNSDDAKKAG